MQRTRYEFYGFTLWKILNHISMPLIMFYRFHSSVCLVDIWRHSYEPAPLAHWQKIARNRLAFGASTRASVLHTKLNNKKNSMKKMGLCFVVNHIAAHSSKTTWSARPSAKPYFHYQHMPYWNSIKIFILSHWNWWTRIHWWPLPLVQRPMVWRVAVLCLHTC